MKDLLAKVRGRLFILKCRLLGKTVFIDSGLRLYCKLVIRGEGCVSIGKNCVISGVVGDKCQYVTIFTHSPEASVRIGNNAKLYAARFSSKHEIIVGDNVLIEESGILDSNFHSISIDRKDAIESKEKSRVKIGSGVSIGARSYICKGVSVGDGATIWPGSVVNKSLPPGVVVSGNPVKAVKTA